MKLLNFWGSRSTPHIEHDPEVLELHQTSLRAPQETEDFLNKLRPKTDELRALLHHNHFGIGMEMAWRPVILGAQGIQNDQPVQK